MHRPPDVFSGCLLQCYSEEDGPWAGLREGGDPRHPASALLQEKDKSKAAQQAGTKDQDDNGRGVTASV